MSQGSSSSPGTCPACGEGLETPLGCKACGAMYPPQAELDPYQAFGLEARYDLDESDLRKRLVRFSRLFHPDFHAGDPEARERAERCTAELNAAHELLAAKPRRADHLVRALGGPDQESERQMPQVFLMEVLEWNETLEEAQAAEASPELETRLNALASELDEHRADTLESIGAALTPSRAPPSWSRCGRSSMPCAIWTAPWAPCAS